MNEQTAGHHEHQGKDYSPACGQIAMERIRYFNGRYLNARDFRDEQIFHLSRGYLHNRLLHGWGVVCGLRVVQHPNPECRDRWVVVKAGIGIDCCGREVIVCEDKAVKLPEKHDFDQYAGHKKLFLCLRYQETEFECVPVLDPDSTCEHIRKENSRIREGYELEWMWLSEDEYSKCGWQSPKDCKDKGEQQSPQQHDSKKPCPSDCDEVVPGGSPGCIEPCCPPKECILLAWIALEATKGGVKVHIEMRGRRRLPPPPDYLTHICDINWTHGGTLTLSEVQKLKQLIVTFDRKLKDPDTTEEGRFFGPTGVNACTFIVQYGGRREDLDFVPYTAGTPPHQGADGRTAVFDMDPDADLERDNYRYLVGHTVFVTLHCGFVHDCRDLPVDGDHAGYLPSGDGVQGGTFLSWFHVVEDNYGGGYGKPAF